MSNFIRFDKKDVQAIIGLVDELEPSERRPEELTLYNKACEILGLMQSSEERVRPSLFRDDTNGRLTIQYGENLSEPVSYNGIARISNFFAVTDFYEGIFPTNVLLRFMHVDPVERAAWEALKATHAKSNGIRKPRWKRSAAESAEIADAILVK